MSSKILIVDDDRAVHHLIVRALSADQLEFASASSVSEALERMAEFRPDVMLLDVMLPDISGLDGFAAIRELDARLPVIFITAAGASDTAIEAMKVGAFDYLPKPIDATRLQQIVHQALESRRLAAVPVGMHELLAPDDKQDVFVGRGAAMQDVFKSIGRVAPQNVAVLIRGESGTGKELVARAIYQHSTRRGGPFLAVNCAALSETLLESELFGHEKGSFTGAHERRIGKFEQCSGGTIFLDEVGDMSPSVQGKVLRLLQEQKFERVGGNQTITTDVRIISATNRDLERMCQENEFRSDLYFRLNGYTITLPSLRERGDDRKVLLEHFLARLNAELSRNIQGIAPDALELLMAYAWPGNVREMQSILRQAVLKTSGNVLMASNLPPEVMGGGSKKNGSLSGSSGTHAAMPRTEAPPSTGIDRRDLRAFVDQHLATRTRDLYAKTLAYMEQTLLTRVLQATNGNQSEAARILGITRGSLRNKLRANQIAIESNIAVAESSV